MKANELNVIIDKINAEYSSYLWKVARRYAIGIWSPEDIYQQIVTRLLGMPKSDCRRLLMDNKKMHSFFISKAIDIVRQESRRRVPSIDENDLLHDTVPDQKTALPQVEYETTILKELLFKRLPQDIAEFIVELAFPSEETIKIAMQDQVKAKEEAMTQAILKTNIHKLVVLPKHVCMILIKRKGKAPSPATITRWRYKAIEAIRDIWDVGKGIEFDNIVKQIMKGGIDNG